MRFHKFIYFIFGLFLLTVSCQRNNPDTRLQGAWETQKYQLKEGSQFEVQGHIFFSQKDWTVLFFVMDETGQPKRGSAEGGRYVLNGDSLEFKHRYNLSGGDAVGSLPESPFRMEIRSKEDSSSENCTIKIIQDQLTIYFPSGNLMTFRRK